MKGIEGTNTEILITNKRLQDTRATKIMMERRKITPETTRNVNIVTESTVVKDPGRLGSDKETGHGGRGHLVVRLLVHMDLLVVGRVAGSFQAV